MCLSLQTSDGLTTNIAATAATNGSQDNGKVASRSIDQLRVSVIVYCHCSEATNLIVAKRLIINVDGILVGPAVCENLSKLWWHQK